MGIKRVYSKEVCASVWIGFEGFMLTFSIFNYNRKANLKYLVMIGKPLN